MREGRLVKVLVSAMAKNGDTRSVYGSREEEVGRAWSGQSSSGARGGPWVSVLLAINDKLEGITSRLDAVERQQLADTWSGGHHLGTTQVGGLLL